MIQHNDTTKDFYNLMSFLECAKSLYDFLLKSNIDNKKIKDIMNGDMKLAFIKFRNAKIAMTADMPIEVRLLWEGQWKKRDYMVFANLFHNVSNLSDEGRATVENYAIHINKLEQAELEAQCR